MSAFSYPQSNQDFLSQDTAFAVPFFFINDTDKKRRTDRVKFHIEAQDYFGTVSTILKILAEEKEIGSIEVGKEADLLIIDKDYMTIPVEEIENVKPLLTMVGGKVVYEVSGAL